MDTNARPGNRSRQSLWKTDAVLVAFVVLIAIGAIVVFAHNFSGNPPGQPEHWGQFGDYLGGVVNPAVGIVTALLVARTLAATRAEAADTRALLESQNIMLTDQLELARSVAESDASRAREEDRRSRMEADSRQAMRVIDAVYSTWTTYIRKHTYHGNFGVDPAMEKAIGYPIKLERVFESQLFDRALIHAIESQRSEEFSEHWGANFFAPAALLNELAIALHAYDNIVGEKQLTDFYRRRVSKAAKYLGMIGLMDPEILASLRVSPARVLPI